MLLAAAARLPGDGVGPAGRAGGGGKGRARGKFGSGGWPAAGAAAMSKWRRHVVAMHVPWQLVEGPEGRFEACHSPRSALDRADALLSRAATR